MSNIINDPVLVTAIQDLARGIKSEADLSSLTRELLKITVEASLNAEMEAHLGYPKHSPTGHNSGNSRNGYGSKSLKGEHGVLEIETPRDRNGTFDPQFVRKNQTRLTHFDDKILTLYAKGMTTRDIVDTFEEMYGAAISATQVSNITEAVMEKIIEWQARPLDEVYPIIYLDCIVVKIKQDKRVINKAIYVALGRWCINTLMALRPLTPIVSRQNYPYPNRNRHAQIGHDIQRRDTCMHLGDLGFK